MPLNARQIDGVKSLLRRAAELIADAQNMADAAGYRPVVIRLNTLRRNMANEIVDLGRSGVQQMLSVDQLRILQARLRFAQDQIEEANKFLGGV